MAVTPEVAEAKKGSVDDILHFCGYEEQPTQETVDALSTELATDPEFELVGTDFVIIPAPDMVLEFFRQMMAEESEEIVEDEVTEG